jgi:hypothetical protein
VSKKHRPAVPAVPPPPRLTWRLPWAGPLLLLWSAVALVFFWQARSFSIEGLLNSWDPVLFGSHLLHPYALKMLGALGVSLTTLAASLGIGHLLLRPLGIASTVTRLETFLFGTALGLGVVSVLTFAAGALHLWYPATFWTILAIAASLYACIRPAWPAEPKRPPGPASNGLWGVVVGALFLLFLFGGLMPEIFFDSLFYHLGFPNQYRLHHRLVDFPLIYANFTLALQMVWGFVLTLGNAVAVKLLHAALAVLLGLSCVAFARRYLSPGAGLLSAAILLSTPLLGYNATTAGMDVGWTFVQFLAAFSVVRALEADSLAWMRVAGLLTGFSAACKYPAMPYIPITMLLILWHRRSGEPRAWREILREQWHFALPALAMVAPYLLRNTLYHGNPLYPFGGLHWGHPAIEPGRWATFLGDAPQRQLRQEFASLGSATKFLLHPWFLTMQGASFSDFVGPLFLMLLPAVIFVRPATIPLRFFRRFGALLWLLWLLTTSTPRYGLPALALLVPVAAQALISLAGWRRAVAGIVALGLFVNLGWSYVLIYGSEGWRVIGGQMSEAEYLGSQRMAYPTPPFDAYAWMNAHLPGTAKILIAGEPRSLYLDRRAVPSAPYDPQPLYQYAQQSSAEAMAEAMRRDGVTHVFINLGEAVRTQQYRPFPFTAEEWRTFDTFWARSVELLWKSENLPPKELKALYVFRLLSPAEAATPHAAPGNPLARWNPTVPPAR